MAIYHCSVKPVKRSAGRSATAAAAYRAGACIADVRTGQVHDYRRRSGVLHAEILTPEAAPDWASDREALWNAAELAEKRKDACLARELVVALPHELDAAQRLALARGFARSLIARYRVAVDLCLHRPDGEGDRRNHHAHLLLTTRSLGTEGFSATKAELELSPQKRKTLGLPRRHEAPQEIRVRWEEHANRALERAGRSERIDHRSYRAQGRRRKPSRHVGPQATQRERRGQPSRIGEENRRIASWNREQEEIRWQLGVVDAAIAQEQDRLDAERKRGRLEEWANGQRAARQNRQLEERGELAGRHDRERARIEGELQAFYGPEREGDEKALETAELALQEGPGRRKARELRARAAALRRNLENIAGRVQEVRSRLARKQREEMATLAERHAGEHAVGEARIAAAFAREGVQERANDNREPEGRAIERARERSRSAG